MAPGGPAYRVRSARLLMRCWNPEDAPALRQALDESDQHLRPWIPWMREEPRTLAQTTSWLRQSRAAFDRDVNYRYAVMDAASGALVGETGLYTRVGAGAREVGYWIRKARRGGGCAGEAANAMVRVAFEVDGVDRVELHCAPDNAASVAVARRLGFTHEATLRRRYLDTEDVWRDSMIWVLFREDYPGSPAAGLPLEALGPDGDRLIQMRRGHGRPGSAHGGHPPRPRGRRQVPGCPASRKQQGARR